MSSFILMTTYMGTLSQSMLWALLMCFVILVLCVPARLQTLHSTLETISLINNWISQVFLPIFLSNKIDHKTQKINISTSLVFLKVWFRGKKEGVFCILLSTLCLCLKKPMQTLTPGKLAESFQNFQYLRKIV